jgi:hypothetical protein
MTLKEAMDFLVLNEYVVFHKKKPVFTQKYHDEAVTGLQAAIKSATALPSTITLAPDAYKILLLECKIPERGYDASGRPYALNKYSKDAEAAFIKAVESGYDPRIIALSLKMYYSSSVAYKKTVTNYMVSGEWQSDYDTIVRKSKDGTLTEHLKKELSDENPAQFTRG